MMGLLVVVITWRHDLISPLPGAPQHDILIMKLTAAKKWTSPEKSPAANSYRPSKIGFFREQIKRGNGLANSIGIIYQGEWPGQYNVKNEQGDWPAQITHLTGPDRRSKMFL